MRRVDAVKERVAIIELGMDDWNGMDVVHKYYGFPSFPGWIMLRPSHQSSRITKNEQ